MSVQLPGTSGSRRPPSASLPVAQAVEAVPDGKAGSRTSAPSGAMRRPSGPTVASVSASTRGRPVSRLRVEEAPVSAAGEMPMASRIEADIAQLNLSFLHVARELSRSARELAVTRLGLDAAACAALDRLSLADLQALAHSHALIFGLKVDASDLPLQAELARTNRIASGARLLLAVDAG
jgi:hypothetical protein